MLPCGCPAKSVTEKNNRREAAGKGKKDRASPERFSEGRGFFALKPVRFLLWFIATDGNFLMRGTVLPCCSPGNAVLNLHNGVQPCIEPAGCLFLSAIGR